MISSMGGGNLSASNFSNISVSLSMVSRKADRIEAGVLLVDSKKDTARNGGRMWAHLIEILFLVVVLHRKRDSQSFLLSPSDMFLKLGTSALKTALPENQCSVSNSNGMGVAELLRIRSPRWAFSLVAM